MSQPVRALLVASREYCHCTIRTCLGKYTSHIYVGKFDLLLFSKMKFDETTTPKALSC